MTNAQLSVLLLGYTNQLREIIKELDTDLIYVDVERHNMKRYISSAKYFHELDLNPDHWEIVEGKEAIILDSLRDFVSLLETQVEILRECE